MKLRLSLFLILTAPAFCQPDGEHWVATWTTPQPLIRSQPPMQNRPAAATGQPAAPRPAPTGAQAINARGFENQTVRMIVRTSIGGSKLRIKLSNPFGSTPVIIGSAHVALAGKDSAIVRESDRSLSFNAKPGCTIGPGMVILSDPVNLTIPSQGDVAVSLFLPGETGPP